MIIPSKICFLTVILTILLLETTVFAKNIAANDCPRVCDREACELPYNCLAGLIKDHCDCCLVCGRREGERCFKETLRRRVFQDYEHYEDCGDNLECRLRTDLSEDDVPEATCQCLKTNSVCGSDKVTYENECQFNEARYKRKTDLHKVADNPCPAKPQIISPPEDVTESIGESISFICESKGWPIPKVEWKLLQDGIEMPLPTDDIHVSVRSRGGPSEHELTSWLQISAVERRHTGHYICVSQNSQGEVRAGAELIVGNYERKLSSSNLIEDEL